jgi:hypothetical protein
VYSKAIQIHRERLERKERLRQEKLGAKEQSRGKGLPEDDQMKANSSRWRNQRGPTIRDAYGTLKLRPEGQQDECDEDEEEFVDEPGQELPEAAEPSPDPVQLALEQQQERERRRLESQRIKQKFLEKTRSPKYQVRHCHRPPALTRLRSKC